LSLIAVGFNYFHDFNFNASLLFLFFPLYTTCRIFFIPLSFLQIPELLVAWERRLRQYLSSSKLRATIPSNALFDTTYLQLLLPAFGFVALYSGLGHKEVRFLYPALPLFNLCAAIGLNRLHEIRFPAKDKVPAMFAKVAYILAVLALFVSFVASTLFVAISRYNYPGGDALHLLSARVNELYSPGIISNDEHKINVKVHIDVASAMTGVNLFGQRAAVTSNPNVIWSFDKDGYEEENDSTNLNWTSYTHLITESMQIVQEYDDFTVVGVAQGNPRFDVRRGTIATSDTIYVLERKNWIPNNRQ
jgi:Alg9-like mannosyltransferase family